MEQMLFFVDFLLLLVVAVGLRPPRHTRSIIRATRTTALESKQKKVIFYWLSILLTFGMHRLGSPTN